MLAEGEGLPLVRRAECRAIYFCRYGQHLIIHYFEEGLPVVDEEWDVMGTHLQDHLGAPHFAVPIAEAGIEEPGIVGAEFAASRFIGDHFSGIAGWDSYPLLGGQDVKLFRFQEKTVVPVSF